MEIRVLFVAFTDEESCLSYAHNSANSYLLSNIKTTSSFKLRVDCILISPLLDKKYIKHPANLACHPLLTRLAASKTNTIVHYLSPPYQPPLSP